MKIRTIKRIAAVCGFFFGPLLFWCGGFNFDERGFWAVACLLTTTFLVIGPLTYPE